MELTNIWFYTLSTCAQVLAALVGLFAVFVVYKIQNLSGTFEDVKAGVVNLVRNYSRFYPTHPSPPLLIEDILFYSDRSLLEKLDIFLSHSEASTVDPPVHMNPGGRSPLHGIDYDFDRKTFSIYRKLLTTKEEILRSLKMVLLFNVLSISSCISLLCFSDYLFNKGLLVVNSLVVILVLINTGIQTYSLSNK